MGSVGISASSVEKRVLEALGVTESYPEERSKLTEENSKLVQERAELNERYNELHEELKGERTLNPADVKEFGKDIAEMFASYTERGEEIRQELNRLSDRESEIDDRRAEIRKRFRDLDEIARKSETLIWEPDRLNGRHVTERDVDRDYKIGHIQGFSANTKTGSIEDALSRGDAYIRYMSPKEYLQRMSYDIFGKSLEAGVRGVNWQNIQKYAKEMKAGTRYDMPWLDYKNRGQEGRHRALAAILNGYDRIPVAIRVK